MGSETAQLNWWSLLPALAFLTAAVLPGLRRSPGRDFFVAGKRAGTATVWASLLATVLGASGTAGIVELAYTLGWGAFWWLGAGAVGLVLLGLVWAPVMRQRSARRTLPEWVGDAYGLPARILAAALIAVMWTAVIAAQWTAAGSVIASLLPCDIRVGIIGTAAVVGLYTALGGQAAVLRTDCWQLPMILIAAGTALAFAMTLPQTAGTDAAMGRMPALLFQGLTPVTWLSVMVVIGGMYVVGPDLCSRVLVARDNRAATRGALWAGLTLLPLSIAIVAIGVRLKTAGAPVPAARDALPWLINASGAVPAPLAGIISAGLLAAMVSSADTCLLTAASVLELDIFGRHRDSKRQQHRARLWTVAVTAASLLIALVSPRIIGNLLLAYTFYAGGLLAPLLATALPQSWRPRRNAWVWLAMGAGGLTPVAMLLAGAVNSRATAGLGGVALSSAILVVGTLQGRRT